MRVRTEKIHQVSSTSAPYRVTSTIDMAREGCDDGPDDGPGFEFDDDATDCPFPCPARNEECPAQGMMTYCCCRRSSSPAKSRHEAPPSPQISNPVVEKAPSRRAEPDEQLEFQGGELR